MRLAVRLAQMAALCSLLSLPVASGEQLGNGAMELSFDAQTGLWAGLKCGGQVLTTGADQPGFDLKQDGQWLADKRRPQPREVQFRPTDKHTLVVACTVDQWSVEITYRLEPVLPMLARSARVTWKGKEPTKLKGFWMGSPSFRAGADTYYFSPGTYPPKRYTAAEFKAGTRRSFGQSLAPLVVEIEPQRSLVCANDELTANSDRGSTGVTELDGALRIAQAFNVQAIMQPGTSQSIGDAWLWLVDGDGEAGLRDIHRWMRLRRHVPPADRPDWFCDAVIYSFHPGGTIGSQFKDLGGFVAAMPLLDQIKELGATAIWIMPIEDASVYHPRDYYKFQPGLGTPEEYRALVDKAHRLGLKVLQDCVPHGGRNDYPRAKEHPEWLAYEEDGSTLDYWCYDFNWPTWRNYMADVARHYVRTFDVDGYRVDAVAGSRILNWNPKIPYARASFAQLQGGLNMLRSLRGAVKELKPREGAILAEVQGSIYGATSDAIYDFQGCYNVFHDLRKLSADEFVRRLRRWLHEQQYAETPDLLRLRHVESHDSLRAELWYGVEPMRALTALTAWIHGIPLVYHEMENGHSEILRRIFAIRQLLPELRRGTADYISVDAPPGVFACLRRTDREASIVLINFQNRYVSGKVSVSKSLLPERLRLPIAARNMWSGRPETVSAGTDDRISIELRLDPFAFAVDRLYEREETPQPAVVDPWAGTSGRSQRSARAIRQTGQLRLSAGRSTATVDERTGMLTRIAFDGVDVVGPCDLLLPESLSKSATATLKQAAGDRCEFVWRIGNRELYLQYLAMNGGLRVLGEWSDEVPPRGAAFYLPIINASRWAAGSREGVLEDAYRVRHLSTEGQQGNIYWRPQGTNVIFDSLRHPIRAGWCGALVKDFGISIWTKAPIQWLDRVGSRQELAALVRCSERGPFMFTILAGSPKPGPISAGDGLRTAAGGWEHQTDNYRVRLSRAGTIVGLWTKHPTEQAIVERADLYTDHGYGKDRTRYAASDEVEASTEVLPDSDGLNLRFRGRLRGFQRFDLLNPPIEYELCYKFGPATFAYSGLVRTHGQPHGEAAFLGLMFPVVDAKDVRYFEGANLVGSGQVSGTSGRVGQTRSMNLLGPPDAVEIRGADDKVVLRINSLSASPPDALANLFLNGSQFFLTFDDGPVRAVPRQRNFSMTITPGDRKPERVAALRLKPSPADASDASVLQDPGFDSAGGQRLVGLYTGLSLPRDVGNSPWLAPAGGKIVPQPVRSGSAAALVENDDGTYRLWRQNLPPTLFPAKSRWRLSAWVKGENIVAGDQSWKVGVLRFAVEDQRTAYVSSAALTGTFDWKQVSVEWTVPDAVRNLRVEAGLNGANGRMWIDDVRLERVNTP